MPTKVKVTKQLSNTEIVKLGASRKGLLFNRLTTKKFIKQTGITHWEELTCVGFNPELSQLEGVVVIKQSIGYSGGICDDGSFEYVRFFMDWGDGSGFQDVGLTSFKAYDISSSPPGPQHPLHYMVYMNVDAAQYQKCCHKEVLPRVRAVLSWNEIPSLDPEQEPHYGNTMDVDIQIDALEFSIGCLIEKGILGKDILKDELLLDGIDIDKAIPRVKKVPMPIKKLAPAYKKARVPDLRLVYDAVYPSFKGKPISNIPSTKVNLKMIKDLKINLDDIFLALKSKESNVSFEELVCLGLNTATDTLGAVIHIKKPCGYGGDLCKLGSKEYVAFWADWNNNGVFDQYLGTTSVDVHDIDTIPNEGLYYSVTLPVNLSDRLRSDCTPNIVRIRAVLSWSTKPSETDPNDLNYYGNYRDALVQLRKGESSTGLMDLIYDVGNVAIDNISPGTYLAFPSTGLLDPDDCSRPAMDRPFGGSVRIGGRIYNTGSPGTVYYQVQYAPHGTGSWNPVTYSHTFELMHPDPLDPLHPKEVKTITATDGWFPYQEDPTASPPILERTNRLAWWYTGSLNGLFDIRLAYKVGPPSIFTPIHYSDIVTIAVDNIDFSESPTPNTTIDFSHTLDLVIDGGDCHSYPQGTTFSGHLRAIDQYFWKWRLELQPSTHTHGAQTDPPCRCYDSLTDNGDGNKEWSLDTSLLDPCGYTATLWAYDRAIINSNGAIVHWGKKAVGFSVIP